MLLGLDDFDIDIFLRLEDENIYIYYSDFETIPELADFLPLGSFDDDGKFKLINLTMTDRIKAGYYFLKRDLYIVPELNTGNPQFRLDRFYFQFKNIPEVVAFCEKYYNQCKNCNNNPCANWCKKVSDMPPEFEFPEYVNTNRDEFFAINIPWDEIPDEDKYYIIVVYFNGIYRTTPDYAQNFGIYQILTDVDFDLNKYSLIVDIKEFFTKEFIYFLKLPPGSLPFANDYGTYLKNVVQTKNLVVQKIRVENEINFFIINFNKIYGNLVHVRDIKIKQQFSNIGDDSWLIEVYADIKRERLVYRLEI